MGEAKRRRQAGEPVFRVPKIEIRDPTEHPHLPGTVTVHVLHENGASLTGSVLIGDVDQAVREGERIARKIGGNRENARKEARTYIFDMLNKNNDHMQSPNSDVIILSTIWLAWTAPDPQGVQLRQELRQDNKLVLALTEYSVYGRRAINGRLMICSPDTELSELLQMFGMGPSSETVTSQLAPH